ncbi:MAG: M23 family metallopeptidase [Bacteroidota bacterium]|nr:M23 family metallopeptidase [Bacteroidota bacterium]
MKRIFNKEYRKIIMSKLKNKYHLVIMNDETFENILSFRLSPMNVFVAVGTGIILLIFGTTYIIAFTPLREYIPGYADVHMQENVRKLTRKVDELEKDVNTKDLYIKNIKNIIQSGEVNVNEVSATEKPQETKSKSDKNTKESTSIKALERRGLSGIYFFTPLKGIIINSFNPKEKHYGVDIVSAKNEPVKATLDGIVISSGWTLEEGNVITIQHDNNIISVYKHNSTLLKKQGTHVKAGESIAIVGNSGRLTTGPHLHFEVWYNGIPVNPKEIINFK